MSAKRLRQLEEEKRRLKQMVADLSLDNQALKEVARKKMLSSIELRHVVGILVETFAMSQRRACRLIEPPRSTQLYGLKAEDRPALRDRLVALAEQRPRFGYLRLHILLRREGFL